MIGRSPESERLSFRAGTYETLYRRAMALLRSPELDGAANPLRNINHTRTDGIIQAFAAAWAVLGDILTFYQERIINEGYLRTATEEYSVRNIVAQLDYSPRPALSARTSLCVTVSPQPGGTTAVTIPARTQIMSVPEPGKLPVIFETDEALVATDAWNARTIARTTLTLQPTLRAGATQVRVNGIVAGVRPGMILVLDGNESSGETRSQLVKVITKVSASANRAFTSLAWAEPLELGVDFEVARVTVLRDTTRLFGANAPAWPSVPVAVKLRAGGTPRGGVMSAGPGADPVPSNSGLPVSPFFAAVFSADGSAWVAGDGGVFRSGEDLPGWQSAWSTIRRPFVRAIAANGGRVYAGTQRGEVYGSADGGGSWYPIGASDGIVPQKLGDALSKLPQSVVRCFAFVERGSGAGEASFVIAGTDRGVFVALDGGTSWVAQSLGLPGSSHTAMSSACVLSLSTCGDRIYAATSDGLFSAAIVVSGGTLTLQWSLEAFRGSVAAVASNGAHVYASGAAGVFVREATGWRNILDHGSIDVLSADGNDLLASGSGSLFRSSDGGSTWKKTTAAAPFLAAALHGGSCVLVAPFDGFVEADWPGSQVAGTSLALDGNYPTLVAPGWVALVQDEPPALFASTIQKVLRAPVEGFGQRADVATLVLDAPVPSGSFSRTTTRVAWNGLACEPYLDTRDATAIVSGPDITLDGMAPSLAPGSAVAVSGQRVGAKVVGTIGGVWQKTTSAWTCIGPENIDARALILDQGGALIVAGGAKVYRRDGASWAETGSGIPSDADIMSLVALGGVLFAGTVRHGVFALRESTWSCVDPGSSFANALAVFGSVLLCGTESGVRYSLDGGSTWSPASGSTAGVRVYAFRSGSGEVIAATGAGLHSSANGVSWMPLVVQPPNDDCRSVDLRADGTICVGTVGGAFVGNASRNAWTRIIAGDVRAAYVTTAGTWWAVRAFGPYLDTTPHAIGTPNDVRAFIADGASVYAAVRSRAVLTAADGSSTVRLDEPLVDAIDGSFIDDFDHATLSTALRNALVAIGVSLSPAARISVLEPGEQWTIDDGGTQIHATRNAIGNINVFRDRVMELLGVPESLGKGASVARYRLRDRDGFDATICALASQIATVSAAPDYEVQTDIVRVDGMHPEVQITAMSFSPPLSNWYDPATVVVCGNVVAASHGESLPMDDVLGSGDATKQNQSFVLHKSPLSIFPSKDGARLERSLEIRVRGNLPNEPAAAANYLVRRLPGDLPDRPYVVWNEVDELIEGTPASRIYTAREDENGVTTVAFGDGLHGRRLPTGSENITASYRTGSGLDGNVPAGALSLMRSRPPGVRGIRNPVPAGGGTAPETAVNIALAAPVSTRTLDRIISLADYVEFAATFPGCAKATASMLAMPSWRGLAVTVAAQDGAILSDSDPLVTTLTQQIAGHRHSDLPFRVLGYRPAYVKIAVEVTIASWADSDVIYAAADRAIRAMTTFAAARFGKPLRASEVITAVQRIPGVQGVRLTALYRGDESPSVAGSIMPAATRFDALLGLLPAELVMLDPRTATALAIAVVGGSHE